MYTQNIIKKMVTTSTEYDLNSAQAAKMLGVTQKTVIRWANNDKFSFVTIASAKGIRYKFSTDEISYFRDHNPDKIFITPEKTEPVKKEKTVLSGEGGIVTQKFSSEFSSIPKEGEGDAYKELYNKKDEELKDTQSKLQKASFHIAQLEEQIKIRVPLIEHKTRVEDLEKKTRT